MKFKTKVVFGFGVSILALVCVAAFSYRSLVNGEEDRKWVAHTYQVMEKLDSVLADMLDAETGVRGFMITGDEEFLDPYRGGTTRLNQDMHDVRFLTADNLLQQHVLDGIEPVVRVRLDQLAEKIELRRKGIPLSATELLQQTGKHTMDDLRSRLSAMKSEEQRLLTRRREKARMSSRISRFFIIFGNAMALTFLMFAGAVIHKEIEQRRKAEEEVRELNADLEQRVTERTAELQAREQDLSRSNAELQQFAYVASHDLQEPLRMVASFTQLLARRYRDKLDSDAREFIDFAVDGATRMQALISDLLAYSRVGTQMKVFERTSCDAVLDRVLRTLKPAIAETQAVITRDPLPEVMADSVQLTQLMQNLLSNAIKFHGKNEPRVHVSAEKSGAVWTISVRDNGIGIAPEHADRVFVIFQRLHTKVEYPGTGIGLAICKKIAERHGGRIWIEPSPGGGATFCFAITAAKAVATTERGNRSYGTHA